jgi:hypothetical protein
VVEVGGVSGRRYSSGCSFVCGCNDLSLAQFEVYTLRVMFCVHQFMVICSFSE